MSKNRQAIMLVSRPLLEDLLPNWQTVVKLRYGDVTEQDRPEALEDLVKPFHDALQLPANCRITGISASYYFHRDEVAFCLECPDFIETVEGQRVPRVVAVYIRTIDTTQFLRWEGPAVACAAEEPVPAQDPTRLSLNPDELGNCWRCKQPTARRLSVHEYECEQCGQEPLL